ncbi:hypothetical protein [Thermoactinospora rubra]|uniref:hypothetical protein n=1 Tax=Thermoactinospora rubra TaxID=1088767 RepID=UPI001180C50F|nr:hypothetical protein [Thermoactinospora rubra]
MGWLAKRRLRTGPTVAVPYKPDRTKLLAVVALADPDAKLDGDDVLAADCRVHAPVEADPDLVGGELEKVWACRVEAEGPLPLDFFDRYLAEGIAARLDGLVVCKGEVVDPADEEQTWLVLLPVRPAAEQLAEFLGEGEADDYGVVRFEEAVLVPIADPSPMGRTLMPYSAEPARVEVRDEGVALRLAEEFQGVVVDRWRFRVDANDEASLDRQREA